MSVRSIRRACLAGALLGVFAGTPPIPAQADPVTAELDAFWTGVVKSVEEWSVAAQRATYHPDAVGVYGTADSFTTSNIWANFAAVAAGDTNADASPDRTRILEFRFTRRVHDANTAHEVGLYHYWAEGEEHYYGTVDSYLVKKDGRWMILVEIQFEPPMTKADWDALPPSATDHSGQGGAP